MPVNILVLGTRNATRSILLESILDDAGIGRIRAFSAGLRPQGRVHPHCLKLLDEMEMETDPLRPKSRDEFTASGAPVMDVVISVSGSAADEINLQWPGSPAMAHWPVADPAATPEARWDDAFQTTFERLNRRTQALLDHPFETMERDALEKLLKEIGSLD
ncbi:arsenate-mycothiol transferase ArsC [Pseudosulfitobacter koreensis]|uniref:Arsenate reductase ArsC n=1 Tax=Pseudosulfitobacter koreensis TaxID=2968472 RepID=A0ABT1Z256_9RHOB|nr:arsenate reductase ArsC [Pseudosulfitobacter koreense]